MEVSWEQVTSGAATVLTLCLLIVTGIYAWLTRRLVRATEQQAWEISRPRLMVALRTSEGGQLLLLHIENIGLTAAEDLRLSLDRAVLQQFGDEMDVREVPIWDEGVRSFPPGSPVRIALGLASSYLAAGVDRERHPLRFTVTATYRRGDRAIQENFPIDVKGQCEMTLVERNVVDDFARDFPRIFSKGINDLIKAIPHTQGAVGSSYNLSSITYKNKEKLS